MKYLNSTIKSLLFLAAFLLTQSLAFAQDWQLVSTDRTSDAADPSLAECTQMEFAYDEATDKLHFRFTLGNMNSSIAGNFGINVMVKIIGAPTNTFKFWGNDNQTNKFNYLLTAWVTGSAPSDYRGTIGIADGAGVSSSNYTNRFANNLDLNLDEANSTITVVVNRKELIPDADLGSGTTTVRFAGATGSSQYWNDDVYDPSKEFTLPIGTTVGVASDLAKTALTLYPNPAKEVVQVAGLPSDAVNSPYVVYNQMGQEVVAGSLINGSLNVAALPKGVFYIKLEEATKPMRFVKA